MIISCAAVLCQTDIHNLAGKEKQAYENQYGYCPYHSFHAVVPLFAMSCGFKSRLLIVIYLRG
jgi:hypothetical protein